MNRIAFVIFLWFFTSTNCKIIKPNLSLETNHLPKIITNQSESIHFSRAGFLNVPVETLHLQSSTARDVTDILGTSSFASEFSSFANIFELMMKQFTGGHFLSLDLLKLGTISECLMTFTCEISRNPAEYGIIGEILDSMIKMLSNLPFLKSVEFLEPIFQSSIVGNIASKRPDTCYRLFECKLPIKQFLSLLKYFSF